jgi:hypothetical protein
MTTLKTLKNFAATSVLLAITAMPAHADLVLDTFEYTTLPAGPYNLDLAADGTGTVATTGGDVIITAAGATAFYTLTNIIDLVSGSDLEAKAAFIDGALSYSEDSGVDGSLSIAYSAPVVGGTTVELDLMASGDTFYFDINQADDAVLLTLTVTDAAGLTSTAAISVLTPVPFASPATERLTVTFASFVGSADFTKVVGINAFITTPGGESQFTIDEVGVSVIPEPSSVALLGLGLLGLGLRSRKKLG